MNGSKMSGVLLALFGLPFAAFGLMSARWTARTLSRAAETRSWVETPARILEARLAEEDDDDGTLYRAEATYEYEFDGRLYRGNRVALDSGYDNVGSFQQDAYRQLARHARRAQAETDTPATAELDRSAHNGRTFRCYVNPRKPREAILYRNVRVDALLLPAGTALLFGGVGFGLIVAQLAINAAEKKREALAAKAPGEPWKWRADWAAGLIRADRMMAVGAVALAGFVNVLWMTIAGAAYSDIVQDLRHGRLRWLLFLVFPAMGVLLGVVAVRETLRRILFGGAVFELLTVPCVLGGKLVGIVRLPRKVRAADGFHLELKCLGTVSSGGGTREQKELWACEETVAFDAESDPACTAIPVQFDVPEDQPETASGGESPVDWRLEVSARNPGPDLTVRFGVPVFRVAGPSSERGWRRRWPARTQRIAGLTHEP